MAFPAYGYAVIVDGKIIFIDRRPSPASIQVNKRNDAMITAGIVSWKTSYKGNRWNHAGKRG